RPVAATAARVCYRGIRADLDLNSVAGVWTSRRDRHSQNESSLSDGRANQRRCHDQRGGELQHRGQVLHFIKHRCGTARAGLEPARARMQDLTPWERAVRRRGGALLAAAATAGIETA